MASQMEAEIYVAAKSQTYTNLSEHSIVTILPHIYFTLENVEDFLFEKFRDSTNLYSAIRIVELLDSFANVNLHEMWCASIAEINERLLAPTPQLLKMYNYNDFEAQNSLEVKIKLVMKQLQHILNENICENCTLFRCCSILESPVVLDEIVAFISAIITGLSKEQILPQIIAGLAAHSSFMARALIQRLILNFPQNWPEVWETLLEHSSLLNSSTHTNAIASRSLSVLYMAVDFTPENLSILNRCIQSRQLPDLLMYVALRLDRDSSDFSILFFFKRVLFDEGKYTRIWFSNYLKVTLEVNRSISVEINARLLSACANISNDPKAVIPKEKLVTALTFLRVIAALRGFTGFSLSPDLRAFVLRLLIRTTGRNERAVNFICYSLAFAVGLRSCLIDHGSLGPDTASNNADTEEQLVVWLRRLISRQDIFHASMPQLPSYSELLILLALLFKNNQQTAIRDLVASTLGVDAPCLMRNISASRKLFTQKVFTEQLIATQAAHVPVTPKLNARLTGNLPIHCVLQLMKTHAFNKNRVQIKGWIYRQICESSRPLHPLLPDLLETYTGNMLASNVSAPTDVGLFGGIGAGGAVGCPILGGCVPFSEEDLASRFTAETMGPLAVLCAPDGRSPDNYDNLDYTSSHDLTPQLLFLYYMFNIYEMEVISRSANANNQIQQRYQSKSAVSVFSDHLWDIIPITYLLRYARSHIQDYRKLYPRLLQLVTNYMPHLTRGEFIIQDELLLDPFWQSQYNARSTKRCGLTANLFKMPKLHSPSELSALFDAFGDPFGDAGAASIKELIVAVNRLMNAVVNGGGTNSMDVSIQQQLLVPYVEVFGSRAPRALLQYGALSGNRRFSVNCCSLWRRLHSIMPTRLEVMTIKALSTGTPTPLLGHLNHRHLSVDPVENVLMRVDRRIFRCPPVLQILLRILECNLLASRAQLSRRVTDRFLLISSAVGPNQPQGKPQTTPSLLPIIGTDFADQQVLPKGFIKKTKTLATAGAEEKSGGATTAAAANPLSGGPLGSNEECERLRVALVTSQEATVVHLLLELCLPSREEQLLKSEVTELREVRGIICRFIRYLFLADLNLASAVFWQTFPRSLIPMAVRAISPLHICMDSVIDVFRKRGDLEPMVFCLDFVSHFAMHYSVEVVLDKSTFLVEVMHHIFTSVLSLEAIPTLLLACGPALCRLGGAFPNLSARIATLFISVLSNLAAAVSSGNHDVDGLGLLRRQLLVPTAEVFSHVPGEDLSWLENDTELPDLSCLTRTQRIHLACVQTMCFFNRLVYLTSSQRRLYLRPSMEEIP